MYILRGLLILLYTQISVNGRGLGVVHIYCACSVSNLFAAHSRTSALVLPSQETIKSQPVSGAIVEQTSPVEGFKKCVWMFSFGTWTVKSLSLFICHGSISASKCPENVLSKFRTVPGLAIGLRAMIFALNASSTLSCRRERAKSEASPLLPCRLRANCRALSPSKCWGPASNTTSGKYTFFPSG